ncbi:molybdenum cofactor guanylyltransferase [Croceicoccus ponticola]|uniref:Molybdenum cofactor guanylyltransferase n=1 Tax=Croceicoccus ponticola TaxID=2217664 RepID=A0A437GXU4_9SPHN|nr:molybdenum cofactor guanylyltransferase [Croceicoccus ponticola]
MLGCVLAGGESRRFGSDKALALLDGETLLSRAVGVLARHCAAVVVAGRGDDGASGVADWPEPGLGPLGGLAGALRHARDGGFAAVLAIGVDSIGLPDDLRVILSPAPACLAAQPVVGLWPVAALPVIETILTGGERRSMLHFAERTGARLVELAIPPANVNTPADLARLVLGPGKRD